MTTSYKHRFARTFHEISREHPELPLGQRFSMANLQIRESRLAALIAELESYRRPTGSSQFGTVSISTSQVPISAARDLPASQPFAGEIPGQRAPQSAGELLQQPILGL
jgi:hypothetical protein